VAVSKKPVTRAGIKARVYYKRYRRLYEALLAEHRLSGGDPGMIIELVHSLVDVNARWSCTECVKLLRDEITIEKAELQGELPLLIGTQFRHPTSQAYLEKVLKKGKVT
jgi:hypothetical protein